MRTIAVIDTTICDDNLGNQIIMEAIYEVIDELFEEDFIYKLQYAEKFGWKSLSIIRKSDYTFFGGTNALSSQMNKYKQMGFSLKDLLFISNKIILFGVGWWQYQPPPNMYTRFFLKKLLSKDVIHSVRDSYTKTMLEKIGINNIINTSCPSTWKLTKEHCKDIPSKKSKDVITTVVDYNKQPYFDEKIINILLKYYDTVYIWIQGVGDLEYIKKLNLTDISRIKFIPPRLKKYDEFLQNNEVDYIGLRLHAGIRALQHKKRTLIIAIDNRAKEIAKDINLNICERHEFNKIISFIENDYKTNIVIPIEEINKWKAQFK